VVDPRSLIADQRQVGVATLTLPDGAQQQGATFTRTAATAAERVTLEVALANGATCTVTSEYAGAVPGGPDLSVPEEVDGPAGPTSWFRSADGTEWEAAATDTDTVGVRCATATAARTLVDRTSW
jgi:hypothetical protein